MLGMASREPITIIGAGLSGLTLGRCLKSKGIPFKIYESAQDSPSHNYGITLFPSTYQRLASLVDLDIDTFKRCTAVDAGRGGDGELASQDSALPKGSFRCNRGRVEVLLRDELQVSWQKNLQKITRRENTMIAEFEDRSKISSQCFVGCDGPHSAVRLAVEGTAPPTVLPYVVFNGSRRINRDDKDVEGLGDLRNQALIVKHHGDVRLEISVKDVSSSYINLTYTYSRPAQGGEDPLYRPNRSKSAAKEIPGQFYQELGALTKLEAPFDAVFDPGEVSKDRLLHWLMRQHTPNEAVLTKGAKDGLLLIGDAAHATSILGGDGANTAIDDAFDLAEHIAFHGLLKLDDFVALRADAWKRFVRESERRIESMHKENSSRL